MIRTWETCFTVAALAFAVLSSTAPATGAENEIVESLPEVTLHSSGVTWQPKADFESAVLTVSGPGELEMRRHFVTGDSLSLDLADRSGGGLPDGQYVWELSFSPTLSPEVEQKLRRARETGDSAVIEGLKLQGKLPEIEKLSGSFRIKGGSVITSDRREASRRTQAETADGTSGSDSDNPVATKDQQFFDDLIVVGSACIGQDCSNGESFGFDTLRLKENNLRIKFQDTSTSASFPTRDWQLTANDSANGGLNKFSIDDIDGGRTPFTIEAGAPSHSLYVEDAGRVGFGTSTPVVELHVKDGNTPTLRLEQDGSNGWPPQTWDVAGNEVNFFIRDVNNGSKLPFRIRPSAPSNSIFVDSDGDVGLGTASPASAFHVSRTGHVLPLFESSDNNAVQFRIKSESDNRRIVALDGSNNVESQIVLKDGGTIDFLGATSNDLHATISSIGLNVNGTISLNTAQIHPDYVFESDYALKTIDEQAAFMWANSHLPAVGPGTYDAQGKAVIDLAGKTMGILEELEKAHIYIAQLHQRLEEEAQERRELVQRLATIEERLSIIGQSDISPRED